MAKVPYSSAYLGPFAVYPSLSGLQDLRTGLPETGGLNLGDYFDLTAAEAKAWGTGLYTGRYRFVQVSTGATAANVLKGMPCALSVGGSVDSVSIVTNGSGQTIGTTTVAASGGGGTGALIQVNVTSATAFNVVVLNPGSGYTTTPTFTLATGGTPGTVLARMNVRENLVTSVDSSAISVINPPRGVFLAPLTAAQISAGAYVFIQELGIATVLVATATSTAVGNKAWTATAGAVTTNVPTAAYNGELGTTIDISAAATYTRVELSLPVRQA